MITEREKQLPRGQILPGTGDRGGGMLLAKRGYEILDVIGEVNDEIPQNETTKGDKLRVVPSTLVQLAGKNLNDIKDDLDELVSDHEWQKVFSQLKQVLKRGQKRKLLNSLNGRLNRANKTKLEGTESRKKIKIEVNRIHMNLLYFINDLRNEDLNIHK